MTTTDPYDPMQRMAERLEAIDATLGLLLQTLLQLAHPPMMVTPDALERLQLDAGIPSEAQPRNVTTTDASWVYLNGTHKRRQGDVHYQNPAPPQRLGDPKAQLNPYFRRVPAIREEESYGETTNAEAQ